MSSVQHAASVAIFRQQQVLLIKRAGAPFRGCWTLPGGRAEAGESPADCARREVMEELGLQLPPLIAVTRFSPLPGFDLHVFACAVSAAAPVASAEIADLQWCDWQALDNLRTTPRLAEILRLAADCLDADEAAGRP